MIKKPMGNSKQNLKHLRLNLLEIEQLPLDYSKIWILSIFLIFFKTGKTPNSSAVFTKKTRPNRPHSKVFSFWGKTPTFWREA